MKMSNTEISYLNVIRDTVNAYLNGPLKRPESTKIADTTSRCLSRCTPGMTIHVHWENTRDPYCAAIYPDIEELSSKSAGLYGVLCDRNGKVDDYLEVWCSIKNWYMMLDPRILEKGNPLCCDDGEQFVGIICHELGHVMSRDPIEFLTTFKESQARMDKITAMALHKSSIVRNLMLPIFVTTSNFQIIVNDPNRHGELEYAADAFVPEEYKGALVSYMENHVLKTTARSTMIKSKEEYKADQKKSVAFSHQALELMTKRRNVLKGRLRGAASVSPNTYMSKLIDFISNKIAGYEASVDKEDPIAESKILLQLDNQMAVVESALMVPTMESKIVTERDISLLMIDVDSIESTDDKLYCIQTIYDYMDYITAEQKKKFKGIKDESVLDKELKKDSRLDTLHKLRDRVINTRIEEKSGYGIFVRYPKGYEG